MQKMIACWGSSGAGKSTVSNALAGAFAAGKKDVLVISVDSRTPMLPVFLPTAHLSEANSIGPLLTGSKAPVEADLKDRLLQHKNGHVFYMGYAPGDVPLYTYGATQRSNALALLRLVSNAPFHYIILDCDSAAVYDQFTMAALEYAVTVIYVATGDVRGYEHYHSQRTWLTNKDIINADSIVKVANLVAANTPIAEARTVFNGFRCELPYSAEVNDHMMAGELSMHYANKPGIIFANKIKDLAAQISNH